MSEINAIATNNYILHNIDAKKLYVQEPLFTANSGDAVYVGWRPDETVLWSGAFNAATTSISLSESYKNFERVKIEWSHFGNKSEPIMEYGNAGDNFMAWGGRGSTNAPFVFFANWSATSDTSLQKNWCKYTNWGQTTAWSDANELVPVKVIGVNRISGGNA